MALVSDFAVSSIIVAGFADGAIKAYDHHIQDTKSIVQTYWEHSCWVAGGCCQKGGSKALLTTSIDGEVHALSSQLCSHSGECASLWHVVWC